MRGVKVGRFSNFRSRTIADEIRNSIWTESLRILTGTHIPNFAKITSTFPLYRQPPCAIPDQALVVPIKSSFNLTTLCSFRVNSSHTLGGSDLTIALPMSVDGCHPHVDLHSCLEYTGLANNNIVHFHVTTREPLFYFILFKTSRYMK